MVSSVLTNAARMIRKYAPTVLVATGTVGVVFGTVVACKETKNVESILEDHTDEMNEIRTAYENGYITDKETNVTVVYSEEDKRRDVTSAYWKTGCKLVKLYLPAGLIIGGSLGCIIGSHVMLSKRNIGLTAAYVGLSESFNNYRENIIKQFGKQADAEAKHNIVAKASNKDDEHPQYYRTERTEETDHSRFYDAESIHWDRNVNMNLYNIHSVQTSLNRKLKTRRSHTVTLNEVYDALDLRPSKDGQVLGYVWRPGDPLDENGIPMVINIELFLISTKGEKVKKAVDEVIATGEAREPVMLLDFPDPEVIV